MLLLFWGAIRGNRWPGFIALAALCIFATPLTSEVLWRWLEHPYQRHTASTLLQQVRPAAVVVLGTGRHPAPGPARVSEWLDADRFFGGLDAYTQLRHQEVTSMLIFTGGWSPVQPDLQPEGDVLRDWAISLGFPAQSVYSTSRVRNTADEAKEVAGMLPNGSTIILVTSAFHMPRARRLFERQGLNVHPFAVDFQSAGVWAGHPFLNPLNYFPTASGLQRSSRAIREVIGRTVYRAW